jgi:xanthosine utilization system XapX-like protein
LRDTFRIVESVHAMIEQPAMSVLEVAACFALLSSAATALVQLVRSGLWRLSYGLIAVCVVTIVSNVMILWWPRFWTPEVFVAHEVTLAVLSALAALALGRSVFRPAARAWGLVCRRAAWVLLPVAAVGALGLMTLAGAPRSGYRGLLVVDAAVAGLLVLVLYGVSLYDLPRPALTVTALRALLGFFALEVVYLGAWEASRTLAAVAGWAATGAYVWAMLTVAREGMVEMHRPIASTVRVSR